MNLHLENKRVLVTGSTGGIGEGIAKRFAQEGATVIINGRREGEAERVAEEIQMAGGKAIVAAGDLSKDEDVARIVGLAQDELGGVDILVNNAAGGAHQSDMGVYSATKAAVNNLTVTFAQAMKDDGVTINTVSPGAILTPNMVEMGMSQGMGQTQEEVETAMDEMMGNSLPFKRVGRIEEIANVVVFLASPLASYVHGANIRVDGGYVPTVN